MNIRTKRSIKDIYCYLQGWYRYKLYYSKYNFLIRKHIFSQIYFRIMVMDQECYKTGSCKLCGCQTTALQMCDKMCDKPCYPPMMGPKKWGNFMLGTPVFVKGHLWQKLISDYSILIYLDSIPVNEYKYKDIE